MIKLQVKKKENSKKEKKKHFSLNIKNLPCCFRLLIWLVTSALVESDTFMINLVSFLCCRYRNEGYLEGLDAGRSAGYQEGVTMGKKQGWKIGSEVGYNALQKYIICPLFILSSLVHPVQDKNTQSFEKSNPLS